ncbi:MAG: hypothetical protein ABI747_04075 [Candidatus Moraniibacteriota bacterium]
MRTLFQSLGKKIWNASFFLFLALFVMSYGYYVTATEEGSDKNFFQDTDQDGLSNDEEKAYGTDPTVSDTDGDGYSDGVEVESGYNPLIAAPGDRIVTPIIAEKTSEVSSNTDNNITLKTSQALAGIVKGVTSGENSEQGVKAEAVDSALQDALSASSTDIVLPQVDVEQIKIKKSPKNLKGEKKDERERKDVLEYLTLMMYLLVNNSPVSITSVGDAQKAVEKISTDSMNALTAGNYAYLDNLEKQGNKFYEQTKDIEVPESMLDTHVKALQLSLYATTLKAELKSSQGDPLGQVSTFGKVQAFLSEIQAFGTEVQAKIAKYGIQDLPLGL